MRARPEFRDRDDTDVAVLDALVERPDGMTVFELRACVETDINELERALSDLKRDGLIVVDAGSGQTVIKPADRVVPDPDERDDEPSIVDWLRDRFSP